jgi:hypothetical protein
MAARPDVAQIASLPDPRLDPVYEGKTPEERRAIEWNIIRVKAPEVWAMGIHGEGAVVASNDTGVDYTHSALVQQYRGNLGGGNFDHNYNWWDGVGGYQYPHDYDGHGTHTTGTMVGDDGGANQIGVAPGAEWIACGGLGGTDPLDCFEFFLTPWDLNGQNPMPEKAPDSINNSWYDPSSFDWRPIIQALNAAGIAVIKSAGNQGSGCSTITNPGYVPEIIATAAFAQGDVIASFSSRGPTSNYGDTILKPEVAAPGVSVRSSWAGGGYNSISGTSMAAPHTTALVALIWSAAPCLWGNVPLTKQFMMWTAEAKIDPQCPPFVDHPNDVWGWGVLDDLTAVQYAIAFCGGAEFGTLEGHVYDELGNPIEGASVTASPAAEGTGVEAITDPNGFYTMELLAGTYDVTASKYGYDTQTAYGVVVIENQTTVQDFTLNSIPVWHGGTPSVFDWNRFDGVYNPHDSLIYFLGGRTSGTTHDKSIWTYNPETGVSADTGVDMLYNAANNTIALIEDDGTGRGEAMYVVGGYDVVAGVNINNVQRFYPQLNLVEDVVADPYPDTVAGYVVGAGGVAVMYDKIFVFGGWESTVAPYFSDKTWLFDPAGAAGSRWTQLPCTLNPGRAYINSAVSDGKIYAMGGIYQYIPSPMDLVPTNVVEVFDTAWPGNCWQPIANMPVATAEGRGFGFDADTRNIYGKLYVVGGGDWPDQSAEVLEYDVATDTWDSTFPEIAQARRDHAGVWVSDCTPDPNDGFPAMWVFGGRTTGDDPPFGDPEYYPLPCEAPPPMFATHVRIIHLPGPNLLLGIVRMATGNGSTAVAGATVEVEWFLPPWPNYPIPQSKPTNANGLAFPIMIGNWDGTYVLDLVDATHPDYVYDASLSWETSATITLP